MEETGISLLLAGFCAVVVIAFIVWGAIEMKSQTSDVISTTGTSASTLLQY